MESETQAQLIQNNQEGVQSQPSSKQPSGPIFTPFIWKFLSVISWILLLITSIIGYIQDTTFFCIHNKIKYSVSAYVQQLDLDIYYPISIKLDSLQTFFIILLSYGFFNFAYFGLYKKDEMIINPMFNKFSNFHFIPLLLISLINILMQDTYHNANLSDIKGHLILDLIFTMTALGFLILIYFKTEFVHDWFIVLTIKKGVFSFLIIILWYNFFYVSELLAINNADIDKIYDVLKASGITCAIFIGIGSLIFSFIFKDLIAALTNLLIYIGMVNSFFGYEGKSTIQKEEAGGVGDGVVEIIIMILNLSFIAFFIYKHSDKITNNKYSFNFS